MKKTLDEFKSFIMRGNVLDLAVGIIIGGAFGKIIASLVEDVIMPPIGLLLGKVDFSSLYINLSGAHYESLAAAQAAGAPVLRYGLFLNTIINFLIVAFAIFMLIKQVKRFEKPKVEVPAAPTTKECKFCLSAVPLKASRCAFCTSEILAK